MSIAACSDVAVVLLFVVIGRRSHNEDGSIGDAFVIAAPFVLALSVAWCAVKAWRDACRLVVGVRVGLITALVGLALRKLVFGRGVALSFAIVASTFLIFGMCAWRAVGARRNALTTLTR